MRFKSVVALSLITGATVALSLATTALGSHARPGTGTPLRVPLVHAYKACNPPFNSTHVAPLALPSCTPPVLESNIVTSGSGGTYSGFSRLTVFCTATSTETTPPCTFGDGQEEEDIQVVAQGTDVRCKVGGVPGCSAANADYTGQLIGQSAIRITDHSSGGLTCLNVSGAGCVTGTTINTDFSVPAPCADNGGPNGANCGVTTTINAQVPGAVKEGQRGIVQVFGLKILDWGNDGLIGAGCPPVCGTGDEGRAADQGVFQP